MGKHVLLLEDEENIVEAIRFLLMRDGWHVEAHGEGRTALDRIIERTPDVLILDLMLPGRSGLDILRDMRADERVNHVPVLMLTARGQDQDRVLAETAGVNRFMTKPFANSDVLQAVREMAPEQSPVQSQVQSPV